MAKGTEKEQCLYVVYDYTDEEETEITKALMLKGFAVTATDPKIPITRRMLRERQPLAFVFAGSYEDIKAKYEKKYLVFARNNYETPEEFVARVSSALGVGYEMVTATCMAHLQEMYRAHGAEFADLSEKEIRERICEMVTETHHFSPKDVDKVARVLYSDNRGYGYTIDQLMKDPTCTEIMVNPDGTVWKESNGVLKKVENASMTADDTNRLAEKFADEGKVRFDETAPILDVTLPDGSRVNAVKQGVSVGGPSITIRKFSRRTYTLDDLVKFGALTEQAAKFLRGMVKCRYTVVVSGGTDSGKTTLLNALLQVIPKNERIVTAEDTKELRVPKEVCNVPMLTHKANSEGRGAVTMRDLIINALRQRPDRLIVGEVRGSEAFDMIEAMNTGHAGSMTSVHADSCRRTITRLENLILAEHSLDLRAVRSNICQAIDVVVHMRHQSDGSRVVSEITEIGEMNDILHVESNVLFLRDDKTGELKWTGNLLKNCTKIDQYGGSPSDYIFREDCLVEEPKEAGRKGIEPPEEKMEFTLEDFFDMVG